MSQLPPAIEERLKLLDQQHPRVAVTQDHFERCTAMLHGSRTALSWMDHIRDYAEYHYSQPALYYKPDERGSILPISRAAILRLSAWALMYKLDGESRFKDRIWQEIDSLCLFPNWVPGHFLDVAEMAHAVALAYDWLYDEWTPAQRETMETAVVNNALKPYLMAYEGTLGDHCKYVDGTKGPDFWVKDDFTWNAVCNGGVATAAIAIYESQPLLCDQVINTAMEHLPRCLTRLGADGAWAEGPGYWRYLMDYACLFVHTMKNSFGSDAKISEMPGFQATPLFPVYLSGPTTRCHNFGDCRELQIHGWCNLMLNAIHPTPALVDYVLDGIVFSQPKTDRLTPKPYDLLFYTLPESPDDEALPTGHLYKEIGIASLRNNWDSSSAWVSVNAGTNAAHYAHLDIGSFVYEAKGVRWAKDLGWDNYDLPDYFTERRWTYFRTRGEGHNTLTLVPGKIPDQDPKAAGSITHYDMDAMQIDLDLTPAWSGIDENVKDVKRSFHLDDTGALHIQDSITANAPTAYWFMYTSAEITLVDNGRLAVLREGKETLTVRMEGSDVSDLRFTIVEARPTVHSPNPVGQSENPGMKRLVIRFAVYDQINLKVVLQPAT